MNEPATIDVAGVGKSYEEGRIRALDGMDLHVAAGEYVALVGPSGCGKSTLLHLIAALDRPDEGIDRRRGPRPRPRARSQPLPGPARRDGVPAPQPAADPDGARERADADVRARPPRARSASGARGTCSSSWAWRERERQPARPSSPAGERQRVAIARALANEPGVILADEPTGSLDSASGLQVMELLESVCRERGATLVLVTHAPDLALRADRIVRMLDGRVLPDPSLAGQVATGTRASCAATSAW